MDMIKLEPNVDIKTNLMDEQLSELPLNKEVELDVSKIKEEPDYDSDANDMIHIDVQHIKVESDSFGETDDPGAFSEDESQLQKMTMELADVRLEQRSIMHFLIAEGVSSAEIYRRLSAVFKENTMSRSRVFEWCARFRRGRKSLRDDARAGAPRIAVTDANIRRVEACIIADTCVSTRTIAARIGICIGSVNRIIHEHLGLKKVSGRWVPKQLKHELELP